MWSPLLFIFIMSSHLAEGITSQNYPYSRLSNADYDNALQMKAELAHFPPFWIGYNLSGKPCPRNAPSTVKDVNLLKMTGGWLEGIVSPRFVAHRCLVHNYLATSGSGLLTMMKFYRPDSETGIQNRPMVQTWLHINDDSKQEADVSRIDMTESQFWIYKVGPEEVYEEGIKQYEYAVVSNCHKYPVTVLVRDVKTFKQKYERKVFRWLKVNRFVDIDNRHPLDDSSCVYEMKDLIFNPSN